MSTIAPKKIIVLLSLSRGACQLSVQLPDDGLKVVRRRRQERRQDRARHLLIVDMSTGSRNKRWQSSANNCLRSSATRRSNRPTQDQAEFPPHRSYLRRQGLSNEPEPQPEIQRPPVPVLRLPCPHVRRVLRLAFLSPTPTSDILDGRQSAGLLLSDLSETDLPCAWSAQVQLALL